MLSDYIAHHIPASVRSSNYSGSYCIVSSVYASHHGVAYCFLGAFDCAVDSITIGVAQSNSCAHNITKLLTHDILTAVFIAIYNNTIGVAQS